MPYYVENKMTSKLLAALEALDYALDAKDGKD